MLLYVEIDTPNCTMNTLGVCEGPFGEVVSLGCPNVTENYSVTSLARWKENENKNERKLYYLITIW